MACPRRMTLYEPQTYYILAFSNPLSFQFHFQRTQNREHLAKRKTNDETEKRRIEEHVAADFLPFVEFIGFLSVHNAHSHTTIGSYIVNALTFVHVIPYAIRYVEWHLYVFPFQFHRVILRRHRRRLLYSSWVRTTPRSMACVLVTLI